MLHGHQEQVDEDLLEIATVVDPYTYFARLRETDPVHWNPRLNAWILTRYSDVRRAFRDRRLSANRLASCTSGRLADHGPVIEILSRWMVFLDGAPHIRLRRLVEPMFRPRQVELLRDSIAETTRQLIRTMDAELRRSGQVDFVGTFATQLPVRVISALLGVPNSDQDRVKEWSDDLTPLVFGAQARRHERARQSLVEMATYLRELAASRVGRNEADLLSVLLRLGAELDDVVATGTLMLFGGHETTTDLLSNGLLQLLLHRDEEKKLRLDAGLMPRAIEEFARFDGPSKAMWRLARRDIDVGKRRIAAGQRVLLVQASANRDPRVFKHPDRFDIGRDPNPHLGFGHGPHYCVGAALARLEASIALQHLLRHYPSLELVDTAVAWKPTILTRSLVDLHVTTSRKAVPCAM